MPKRKQAPGKDQPKQSKKKPPNIFTGLTEAIKDPELVVKSDDKVVVIKDKYPKAKYHFLVLPKENIASIKDVTDKHLDLLEHMERVGLEIIKGNEYKNRNFKLGYHSEPSMSRLHLHVISDDMISDCLKTKKHWNSFTTDFFIKSQDVISSLRENSTVPLPTTAQCKTFLNTELKCHKCVIKPKNMPDLKKHLLTHENT